jgi:hypothetical protein
VCRMPWIAPDMKTAEATAVPVEADLPARRRHERARQVPAQRMHPKSELIGCRLAAPGKPKTGLRRTSNLGFSGPYIPSGISGFETRQSDGPAANTGAVSAAGL